jgi:hypothetical protein
MVFCVEKIEMDLSHDSTKHFDPLLIVRGPILNINRKEETTLSRFTFERSFELRLELFLSLFKSWPDTIRFTGIYCMFALLLCRLCLQGCSLRNKFVCQLNLVFLWLGHILCYKPFSRNRVSWHLLYFQNVLWSKNRSQDPFQNKEFTKTSIYNTTGI